MAPGLGASAQGSAQFPGLRWGGQERTDDREAQPRPAITIQGIASNCHAGSFRRGERLAAQGKAAYKAQPPKAIAKLCGSSVQDQRPSVSVLNGARKRNDCGAGWPAHWP